MKRDLIRVVQADAVRELGEVPADGRIVTGPDEFSRAAARRRREQATQRAAAFDDRREGHDPAVVQARGAEAPERPADGRRVALRDGLSKTPTRRHVDRVNRLAAALHRCEERDLVAVVQSGRLQGGDHAGGEARRDLARHGDRARRASRGADEDPFEPAAAGQRCMEGDAARLVQGRDRMPAEAGDGAGAHDAVALRRDLDDPGPRGEEESFARGGAGELGEERDLSAAVHRRDDRQRFHAEAVKGAAGR